MLIPNFCWACTMNFDIAITPGWNISTSKITPHVVKFLFREVQWLERAPKRANVLPKKKKGQLLNPLIGEITVSEPVH